MKGKLSYEKIVDLYSSRLLQDAWNDSMYADSYGFMSIKDFNKSSEIIEFILSLLSFPQIINKEKFFEEYNLLLVSSGYKNDSSWVDSKFRLVNDINKTIIELKVDEKQLFKLMRMCIEQDVFMSRISEGLEDIKMNSLNAL